MSRVFVVRDVHFERDVVVKVLSPELAAGLSGERFTREVMLAAQLQEPHIVPVIRDGVTASGLPFYMMPFVRGASLRQRIEEGPVPYDEAISILRDVARALAFAHGRGVVHRDIKPENVLLNEGTAVVTDFGIAKAVHASRTQGARATLTEVGSSIGTPAYMAPEQASGDAVDHRTDLYSWGVMAYELLTGAHPFRDKTTSQQLIAAHISATPANISRSARTVPAPVVRLVMATLEKNPDRRPQSAESVLTQLADGEPVRRSPRGAWIIAAVCIALIGAGGLWWRTRAAPVGDRSVAILPFVNAGGDSSQTYFAEGMADELTTSLSRIPGLRVAAVSAVSGARAAIMTPQEAGSVLHVATLLMGAVQRSGDLIRVRARLVNAADGSALWSDHFDERATDVFGAQDHLAQRITTALHDKLATNETAISSDHGTRDPQAFDLYLRGKHLFALRGRAGLHQAINLFTQATKRDSMFGRAWSGLAMAYAVLPTFEADSSEAWGDRAIAYAHHALALDSNDVGALNALGYAYGLQARWAESEADLRKAIALEPRNLTSHHWYADMLYESGRLTEALREMRLARDLDPLSAIVQSELGNVFYLNHQYDSAVVEGRKSIALDSTLAAAYTNYASAFLFLHQPDSTEALLETAMRMDSVVFGIGARVGVLMQKGNTTAARLEAERQVRTVHTTKLYYDAVCALVLIGENKRALDILDDGIRDGQLASMMGLGIGVDPLLDPIAHEPRFRAFLAKYGITRQ